jgi:ABC-type phosphate transport system substrate-binding protein
MRSRAVIPFLSLILIATLANAAQPPYRVVVNSANPVSSMSAEEVSRLFLKRDTTWAHGVPVEAVDLVAGSTIREAFSQDVHNRDVAAIKNYWQRMIFSGRAVPPPEKATDEEVLEFVRSSQGAVGYVSASTAIGNGVKTIEITSRGTP